MTVLKKFGNNVAESSETLGDLDYELQGNLEGYFRFRDQYANGDTPYFAVVSSTETKKEYNKGLTTLTYGTPDTLLRATWLSTNSNNPVVWDQDDLPLMVYVPTAGELFEVVVTGWLETARNAMLSFGFWFKKNAIATDRHLLMIYDGNTDVPVGAVNAVTHKAWVHQKRTRVQSGTMRNYTCISIPADNSIPQNTEGTALPDYDCAVTIESATSKIYARVGINANPNGVAAQNVLALFVDSVANALAAQVVYSAAATGQFPIAYLDVEIPNPGAGAHTYKLRMGGLSSSIATTFNGTNGTAYFGGTFYSYLEIVEEFQ